MNRDGDPLNPVERPKIGNVRAVDNFGNVESRLVQISTARVPRYLIKALQEYSRSLSYNADNDSRVKIIGFGQRFSAEKTYGAKFEFHYQAPKLVLFSQVSPSADIWS